MQALSDLFIHQPANILIVAALFLIAHLIFKRFSASNDAPLLVPAVCWAVYAAWEFAMTRWNPQSGLRSDLLVVWPILLLLTIWFVIQAFR